MNELLKHLSTQRREPRLWVERLELFREPDPEHLIRAISLRRGMNVIWACEPDESSRHAGIHAAGHGVGKTSLCLLLRYCLGDSSKSIDELRAELISEVPQGGVGAVVHVEGKPYAVFRHFNAHREGMVEPGGDLASLLANGGSMAYKEFETLLSGAMLSGVAPRAIPETGQVIEWRHVLAWIARDQAARFKGFFSWRDGEGVGLQRARQDPPIVLRAVLGLVDNRESDVLARLRSLQSELEAAQTAQTNLLREPGLIRGRIESEVRVWLEVPRDLPMVTNDFFKDSVEQEITKTQSKAETSLAQLGCEIEVLEEALLQVRIEYKQVKDAFNAADVEYQMADAARLGDEAAYKHLAEKRERLKSLAGLCEHGQVLFQQCQHIQAEIQAVSFVDKRDQNALLKNAEDWTGRAVQALKRRNDLNVPLKSALAKVTAKENALKAPKLRRDTLLVEKDRGQRLLKELARWEQASGSPEAAKQVVKAAELCAEIQRQIDSARTQLSIVQHEISGRERVLGELTDALAQELLSREAFGTMDVRDELRPFRLSLRGGEAFRVLEILLGDLVCLLDASNSASTFPGMLIHDCPREADMGPRPYADFLHLIERIETQGYGQEVPFQYIITTTTPPPESLQVLPYLRLTLDPSREDGLLFKSRFNSQIQMQTELRQ